MQPFLCITLCKADINPPPLPSLCVLTRELCVCLCWLQAHWVVAVREPSEEDISAAFKVFDEHHLVAALHTMPQVSQDLLPGGGALTLGACMCVGEETTCIDRGACLVAR